MKSSGKSGADLSRISNSSDLSTFVLSDLCIAILFNYCERVAVEGFLLVNIRTF